MTEPMVPARLLIDAMLWMESISRQHGDAEWRIIEKSPRFFVYEQALREAERRDDEA